MKRKDYERELRVLHGELVAMQEWVKASGAKICLVFEGRDTAGKGGTIKAITERVSPRVFRVVALPAPNEREKSQMFIQRYMSHFPAAGEVVIFDRSWYNRAGIERVMGFCTEAEVSRFLEGVALVERTMVESGIILVKYWLEVSQEEQTRRLESRINDPRKLWKLSDMDLKSYSRWWDYERARDDMFRASDTAWAPWYIAHTDDKKCGAAQHHHAPVGQIPYKPLEHREVTLPKRQKSRPTTGHVRRCPRCARSRRRSASPVRLVGRGECLPVPSGAGWVSRRRRPVCPRRGPPIRRRPRARSPARRGGARTARWRPPCRSRGPRRRPRSGGRRPGRRA